MAERPRCLGSIEGWYWIVLSGGKSSTRVGMIWVTKAITLSSGAVAS